MAQNGIEKEKKMAYGFNSDKSKAEVKYKELTTIQEFTISPNTGGSVDTDATIYNPLTGGIEHVALRMMGIVGISPRYYARIYGMEVQSNGIVRFKIANLSDEALVIPSGTAIATISYLGY